MNMKKKISLTLVIILLLQIFMPMLGEINILSGVRVGFEHTVVGYTEEEGLDLRYRFDPIDFGNDINTGSEADDVKNIGGKVVGIIKLVGTIVSVGMLMILGIKYMMGSAEEKAEYKKTLFPYIIGSILIFATTNLTQILYDLIVQTTE